MLLFNSHSSSFIQTMLYYSSHTHIKIRSYAFQLFLTIIISEEEKFVIKIIEEAKLFKINHVLLVNL